jgi:hypothetical protein
MSVFQLKLTQNPKKSAISGVIFSYVNPKKTATMVAVLKMPYQTNNLEVI